MKLKIKRDENRMIEKRRHLKMKEKNQKQLMMKTEIFK